MCSSHSLVCREGVVVGLAAHIWLPHLYRNLLATHILWWAWVHELAAGYYISYKFGTYPWNKGPSQSVTSVNSDRAIVYRNASWIDCINCFKYSNIFVLSVIFNLVQSVILYKLKRATFLTLPSLQFGMLFQSHMNNFKLLRCTLHIVGSPPLEVSAATSALDSGWAKGNQHVCLGASYHACSQWGVQSNHSVTWLPYMQCQSWQGLKERPVLYCAQK